MSNVKILNMDIGRVAEGLKAGRMFRRPEWPEEHFIFRQIPAHIDMDIVPNMQSLPDTVKQFFQKTFDDPERMMTMAIHYENQVAYVGSENVIKNFAFQAEDVLATDWQEFKLE